MTVTHPMRYEMDDFRNVHACHAHVARVHSIGLGLRGGVGDKRQASCYDHRNLP